MINLLVEIKIPDRQFCRSGIKCEYLKYIDGVNAYCTLFNKPLKERDLRYPHRCIECKTAEDRYTLYEH